MHKPASLTAAILIKKHTSLVSMQKPPSIKRLHLALYRILHRVKVPITRRIFLVFQVVEPKLAE